MNQTPKWLTATLFIASIALASVISIRGTALSMAPAGPVAYIDLVRVINGLAEKADAEAKLNTQGEGILGESEARQKELQELNEAIGTMELGPDRINAQERLDEKYTEFLAWQEFTMRELDIERALLMQGLYEDVMTAVQKMAQREGLDMVFIYSPDRDIQIDPQAGPLEDQVRNEIRSRRIAFSSARVDRTEDVIIRMNNEYEMEATGQ
jgi:Skp family chaperone for outer membrane proteins